MYIVLDTEDDGLRKGKSAKGSDYGGEFGAACCALTLKLRENKKKKKKKKKREWKRERVREKKVSPNPLFCHPFLILIYIM